MKRWLWLPLLFYLLSLVGHSQFYDLSHEIHRSWPLLPRHFNHIFLSMSLLLLPLFPLQLFWLFLFSSLVYLVNFMKFLKFLVKRVISQLPSSFSDSNSCWDLQAVVLSFIWEEELLSMLASNFSRDPMIPFSFRTLRSLLSSMAVVLEMNFSGSERRIFLTTRCSCVSTPKCKESWQYLSPHCGIYLRFHRVSFKSLQIG